MLYRGHYQEKTPRALKKIFSNFSGNEHKTNVWNTFVDSELLGVNDDDCAILPRVLPSSYLKEIYLTSRDLTLFSLKLLSLPEKEIRAIIPKGPIRDFLLDELEVLKFRSERMVGSYRFDTAIVGEPKRGNPPKLLELNEIGFGGLARSTFIESSIFQLVPELKSKLKSLNAIDFELRNMKRLSGSIARLQYGEYDWEEELLLQYSKKRNFNFKLICPKQFKCFDNRKTYPLIEESRVSFKNKKLYTESGSSFGAVQIAYSFELNDYKMDAEFYRELVRSRVPQYGPFVTGLVASKMILVLLNDASLRRKLLGSAQRLKSSILEAHPLLDHRSLVTQNPGSWVLKHVDGLGGELVYIGKDLEKKLPKIKSQSEYEWILQERTKLNVIDVNGILSRPKKVIADLGVIVQYDFYNGELRNFTLGGTFTRATNKSYKVNVSTGGLQVPVMYLR